MRSAGTTPADEVLPTVVTAMAELGIDVSAERPKAFSQEALLEADVVITMGCGDACPVFPGKRYMDWDLPDPTGKHAGEVRAIRDRTDALVAGLLGELAPKA